MGEFETNSDPKTHGVPPALETAFRLVSQHVDDFLAFFYPDFTIAWCNQILPLHIGFLPPGTSPSSLLKMVHPDDRDRISNAIHAVFSGDNHANILYRVMNSWGGWRHMQATLEQVSVDAEIVLAVFHARDVSELIALRNDLLQTEKSALVSGLLPMLAHNINNPLEGIKNYLYLLQHTAVDADREHYFNVLNEEVTRIAVSLRKLLSLHSSSVMKKELLNCEDLINDSLHLLEFQFHDAGIDVETILSGRPHFISGYKILLKQILLFILETALHSLEESRHPLIVQTRQLQHGEFEISLSHRGNSPFHREADMSGIYQESTHEQLNSFYEQFSIIRAIIEDHYGTILIDGHDSQETKLIITFPLVSEKRETSSP